MPPSPIDYARAQRFLARRDPVIAALIKQHGACAIGERRHFDPFSALVRVIVGQQLSTKAAATIYSRVAELPPGGVMTPEAMRGVPPEAYRGAGLSRQKLSYVIDLCEKVLSGALHLDSLEKMDDDEVIAEIVKVKGLGRWSAEMFLMFRLHRPDVLPVGDLGIVKAIQRAYRLRKPPKPEKIVKIGEAWRPYRSIACWYLWRSLDNEPA